MCASPTPVEPVPFLLISFMYSFEFFPLGGIEILHDTIAAAVQDQVFFRLIFPFSTMTFNPYPAAISESRA